MKLQYFVTPEGWTRNEELEDSYSAVFTTCNGTRIVISKDCTPCGFYNVYAKKNFPEGEGKMLGTRCKLNTCIIKAKQFDTEE